MNNQKQFAPCCTTSSFIVATTVTKCPPIIIELPATCQNIRTLAVWRCFDILTDNMFYVWHINLSSQTAANPFGNWMRAELQFFNRWLMTFWRVKSDRRQRFIRSDVNLLKSVPNLKLKSTMFLISFLTKSRLCSRLQRLYEISSISFLEFGNINSIISIL